MWSVFSLTTDLLKQQHVISCWVVNVNDTLNYSIKKVPTLLDFSSLEGTVCYTVSANWECLEHPACVTESLVVLPCLKLSLIWHTKVKTKSEWSVKTYIKADHNTITPFGIKVMSKYKVLSKRECGMIKNILASRLLWISKVYNFSRMIIYCQSLFMVPIIYNIKQSL